MLTFHLIAKDELLRAAGELAEFGIHLAKDGVTTRVEEGDALRIKYEAGEILITVQKRVQLFYALKLLADECAGEGFSREEKCAFQELTYMLDCSRNAVPNDLTSLIRHLAVLGYDCLGLYMEDTFVVEEYPYFGYLRTPFTAEDIRRADEYCKLFGIELVPYIQTLAHFNTLTRHYAMGYLFDCNDILLAGEEETYRFIDTLIGTCAKYFTSRKINIGMDEAYMLGRGAYLDKHGARSRFEIMNEHLARVIEICKKYGFKPSMWSDMFFSLAMSAQYGQDIPEELAKSVPEGVELVYWDYCSTSKEHYAAMMQKHRAFKNELAFAAGAWKWLGYTPDNRYAFVSCAEAARACLEKGVEKYIVTGWGDNGAECSVFATLPSLLYCSRFNYGHFDLDEAFKRSFYSLAGMKFEDFMTIDLCNRVTENDDVEEKNSANKYLLFNDILLGTLDTTVPEGVGELYGKHAKKLARARKRAGKWQYLFETQYALARVLEYKADMGIKLRRAYREGNKEELKELCAQLVALRKRIQTFYCALKVQWHLENRANGFDVQDIRIGALKQRLETAIEKVRAYLDGKAENIPELEEKLLDHMGHAEEFEIDPDQCEWRWRRMTSVNMNE